MYGEIVTAQATDRYSGGCLSRKRTGDVANGLGTNVAAAAFSTRPGGVLRPCWNDRRGAVRRVRHHMPVALTGPRLSRRGYIATEQSRVRRRPNWADLSKPRADARERRPRCLLGPEQAALSSGQRRYGCTRLGPVSSIHRTCPKFAAAHHDAAAAADRENPRSTWATDPTPPTSMRTPRRCVAQA